VSISPVSICPWIEFYTVFRKVVAYNLLLNITSQRLARFSCNFQWSLLTSLSTSMSYCQNYIWPKISILCNYCCRLLINLDFCLNHMLYMCPPRAETQAARGLRHCFMALSISCWSILSHSLLWFLQKRHNYDTAQKHLTDSVKSNYHQLTCSIMDIRWKFHKICPNTVGNIWKTNISLFSEHGVYFKLRVVRRVLSFCINLIGKLSSKKWTRPNMSTTCALRWQNHTVSLALTYLIKRDITMRPFVICWLRFPSEDMTFARL